VERVVGCVEEAGEGLEGVVGDVDGGVVRATNAEPSVSTSRQ
jgi:hypothetical protein